MLFAAICPIFGARFAFHADSQKQADSKISRWNRYHSFTHSDSIHTAKKIKAGDVTGLEIHDEYVS